VIVLEFFVFEAVGIHGIEKRGRAWFALVGAGAFAKDEDLHFPCMVELLGAQVFVMGDRSIIHQVALFSPDDQDENPAFVNERDAFFQGLS